MPDSDSFAEKYDEDPPPYPRHGSSILCHIQIYNRSLTYRRWGTGEKTLGGT
jgi:hypothetical protein